MNHPNTSEMMVWGPATRPQITAADVHLRDYERYVEAPRRRGIDPVWQAMLNEAYGETPLAEVA